MSNDPFEPYSGQDVIIQSTELHEASKVPVEVCGPVEVRPLAARNSALRGIVLPLGQTIKISGHNPRRKRLSILCYDAAGTCTAVNLGHTKAGAEGPYAYVLPMLVTGTPSSSLMLEMEFITELWATAITGPCTLSVLSESWI